MVRVETLRRLEPISGTQRASYALNGYLILRGALSASQVVAAGPVIDALVDAGRNTGRAGERVVHFDLAELAGPLRSLLLSEGLGRIAASLLDVSAVRVLYASSYFKPPGAPGSHWHQDLWYFPIDPAQVVTLWVPLDDVGTDMSPLRFAVGSHRKGVIEYEEDAAVEALGFPIVDVHSLAAGDVCAHDGWMFHGTMPNASTRTRRALGICYFADGATVMALAALRENAFRFRQLEHYLAQAQSITGPIGGAAHPRITAASSPAMEQASS